MKETHLLFTLLFCSTFLAHCADELPLSLEEQALLTTVHETIASKHNCEPQEQGDACKLLITPENELTFAGLLTQLPADSQERTTLEQLLVKELETMFVPIAQGQKLYGYEYVQLLKTAKLVTTSI